jgi:hypothetical protein
MGEAGKCALVTCIKDKEKKDKQESLHAPDTTKNND